MPGGSAIMPGPETVEQARAGDMDAFSKLYDYYQIPIYRFIAGQVSNISVASDLMQDTFVRAWLKLDDLVEPRSFKSWLFRIARNIAIDHLRSERPGRTIPLHVVPTGDLIEPDPLLTVQERDRMQKALRKLPRKQRQCLLLQAEGFSHQEIADVVGLRVGSVSIYISYARRAFIEHYRSA